LALEAGDKILFVTTHMGFSALQACFAPKVRVRKVMVIGGGNVGYMVARGLVERRLEVMVIEPSQERCEWLASELPGALVVRGDGTDLELLEAEGMAEADAVVAVTDNDEKNLLASLLAKQLGVKKVITRVSRSENRRLFEQVGIDLPLTPRQAAVREVLDWLGPENVEHLAVMDESIELLEVDLPERFPPTPLAQLQTPEAVVVALERGHRVMLAQDDLEAAPGDKLFLVAAKEASDEVVARFLQA